MKSLLLTMFLSLATISHSARASEGLHCREGSFTNDLTVTVSGKNPTVFLVERGDGPGESAQTLASGVAVLRNQEGGITIYDLLISKREGSHPELGGILVAVDSRLQRSKVILGNRHFDLMSCWKSSN